MEHTHLFALYVMLNNNKENSSLIIEDPLLYHRIVRVLRLKISNTCILFDQKNNTVGRIQDITPKKIHIILGCFNNNRLPRRSITCALPILKRDNLDAAVQVLTEVGVSCIQLITTQKTHRSFNIKKEIERLSKIIIAGAEQSKNFSFPYLREPITIETLLSQYNKERKILFHPTGKSLGHFSIDFDCNYLLITGPEGDLTLQELAYLQDNTIENICLTPTILRTVTAIQLGAGIVNSLLNTHL